MPGTLLKIKEVFNNLNKTEKRIAEYILENPDDIIHLSIGELAERCSTSQAAIVRFCKSIQYNGYKDFKIDITPDILALQKDDENKYTDIKPGDKLESIIENVCINNIKSIDDTLKILDYNEVERAVDAINKSRRIDFYGVGASGIIALDGQQKFMRIHKYCFAYTDSHLQITSAATLEKGDVAIIISYSGETKDIIESAKAAKESGATVISITKYGKSTLSELSNINLFLTSPETSIRSGAMGSRIAQLNMIDIIFSAVASMEYKDIKKYLDKTHKATLLKKYNK
ncbi:MAG: MurR/RpiR family transcriptional regulator [Clostridiales bacterium]|nr:MurR/RpiR family transcriptional regulator [Clostridiales bacterium]